MGHGYFTQKTGVFIDAAPQSYTKRAKMFIIDENYTEAVPDSRPSPIQAIAFSHSARSCPKKASCLNSRVIVDMRPVVNAFAKETLNTNPGNTSLAWE